MQNFKSGFHVTSISGTYELEQFALELFHHQSQHNIIYRNYLQALKIAPAQIKSVAKIPFLPIGFFKRSQVVTGTFDPALVFSSSGTTGSLTSRHHLKNPELYEEVFTAGFRLFYGSPEQYSIFGLLPSYLERKGSSLVTMVQKLIELSGQPDSGFFLDDHEKLAHMLTRNEENGKKSLLLGVTFALLDFAEKYSMPLKNTIVMETGGMKGRREELTREEVTLVLKDAFHLENVHSEYGMTELLSQAYSRGNGIFHAPPWMRVFVRDPSDPLSCDGAGSGALNVIDLANIDSCAFIATEDLGRLYEDGSFEVLGRMDQADVRGCNLLVA